MLKFSGVGRSSPCQSVLVSFLVIMVSSGLINTSLAVDSRYQEIVNQACNPNDPHIRRLHDAVKNALSKSIPLAQEYIKTEVKREYQAAMASIHTHKSEWHVIKDIPKSPGVHTDEKVLREMNEQNTLVKVYKDLWTVHRLIVDRKYEAGERKRNTDVSMYTVLDKEVDWVIEAFRGLFKPFGVKEPTLQNPKPFKMSTDLNEHLFRNWITLHEDILVLEYVDDIARFFMKKYCGYTV